MPYSESAAPRPDWSFAEYSPVGVELGTADAVAAYDGNQGTVPGADDRLLDRLGVREGSPQPARVVDLACGTGAFAVRAALRGAEVHGVDVSKEMLAHAQRASARQGVTVHWHHAGFLDYEHMAGAADVVTAKSALHQLPDFFKQQALLNAAQLLRPGGLFYLWDVIFTFPPEEADAHVEEWLDAAGTTGFTRETFATHVREEFSTYDWVLAGMLTRAGFEIVSRDFPRPTHGEFVCRKS